MRPDLREDMVPRSILSDASAHLACTEIDSFALVAAERRGRDAMLRGQGVELEVLRFRAGGPRPERDGCREERGGCGAGGEVK